MIAKNAQPSIIFIGKNFHKNQILINFFSDEIDSILGKRTESENEATRRIKTEFLAIFGGTKLGSEDRVFLLGATNRPQDIDDAAMRRFGSKVFVDLPDVEARQLFIKQQFEKSGLKVDVEDGEFE